MASIGSASTAMAIFSDTDTIEGSVMQSGVLDIKLSEIGPTTHASTTDEHQQDTLHESFKDQSHGGLMGTSAVTNTLRIDNSQSTLDAEQMGINVSYTEDDGTMGMSGNAETTAKTIQLTEFTYHGSNLLTTAIRDENGNGMLDVDDLTQGQTKRNLATLSGVNAGDTADIRIGLQGDTDLLESLLQPEDGINITFKLIASSHSFTDADSTTNNTIRYALLNPL
ncbi:hypothetical protein [Haladaptatus sp. R4]|uniref:hypothetical protein n=1 Tax=Haladaptatus sp. R4 TaxID=1679489 RepID=UPI0012371BC1|nr:hypothetical protein [Haladaptatus sp. R4]